MPPFRPAAPRPFTAALIGPDGSGKTTIARRLERDLPVATKYIYMGVSRDSSSHMLPTTRAIRAIKRWREAPPDTAGPPDASQLRARGPRRAHERALASIRSALRLTNQLAEEWYREALAWGWVRRGVVVVFDRHFFSDYYAYDIEGGDARSVSRRIHGFVLERLSPKPDLVVYLDAPADVLLARKGEGTIEALARRRRDYLELAAVTRHFAVVDASRPEDEVAADVQALIDGFAATGTVDARWAAPAR